MEDAEPRRRDSYLSEDEHTPRSESVVITPAAQLIDPEDAQGQHSPPPPPPPNFNPPADFSIDSPLNSISTPSTSAVTSPTRLGPPGSTPEFVPGDPTFSPQSSSLQRPQLQAFQRLSNESFPTPGSGTSSLSSTQSESGEHLEQMREGLRERLLQSEGSTPSRSRANSVSTVDSFRFNITNSTPPSETTPYDETLEDDYNEPGPSRPRRLSSSALANLEEENDLPAPAEHAWDSVWPAPGSGPRNAPPEPSSSRFPIAPVSPFVTPSFSPAIISTNSATLARKPPSPVVDPNDPASPSRRSQSPASGSAPFRFSPRTGGTSPNLDPYSHIDMYHGARRRSITADAPLLAQSPPNSMPIPLNLNKHHRSHSNSSQSSPQGRLTFEKIHRGSPIGQSPPRSPMRPPLHIVAEAGRSANPSEEKASGSNPSAPPLSAPPTRLTNPGASPPLSALTKGRPRGKSLSSIRPPPPTSLEPPQSFTDARRYSPRAKPVRQPDVERSTSGTDEDVVSPLRSSASLPPIFLPPAVAAAPATFPSSAPQTPDLVYAGSQARPASPPLFAPLARPAILRRALSDYDPKTRSTPPAFHRTLSITAELDKSPKRTTSNAEIISPVGPEAGGDRDTTRARKSPKASPRALPMITPITQLASGPVAEAEERVGDLAEGHMQASMTQSYFPDNSAQLFSEGGMAGSATHMGDVGLVDEGDVLPMGDVQMDVTFDDEGLNTLERIFLLSKSEYPFHRAYVARVLGDLLNEVDPCESVEYVLPLLSGFPMDDDETVKEAFASELHRILWYFYSTCKLLVDDGEGELVEVNEPEPTSPQETPSESRKKTLTVTSEGVSVVNTPTVAEATEVAIPMGRQKSTASLLSAAGTSSTGSSLNLPDPTKLSPSPGSSDNPDIDTPNSSVSNHSLSSQDTAFSPGLLVKAHADDGDDAEERGYTKEQGVLADRPILAVNFFTPLVGSLMLNQNPVISESVRNGIVAVLGRLRGQGDITLETWGHAAQQVEPDERRTFVTQNGPHQHDLRPFSSEAKAIVEHELLQGIIIGMGQLSTEMPEMIFDDPENAEEEIRDHEAFQAQLIQEATAGRATSMNLIGSVCEFFDDYEVVENGFVDEVLASGDGDVPVRAEAAVAMSYLAKMVPIDYVYHMLPLFEAFCEDENDHVKQSACLSLPALCKRIESSDYRRSFAVKAVQTLMAGDEDVRCAALEMLGEVIYIFHDDPQGPPDELLDVYTDDSEVGDGQSDSDWDVVAIFNFPGVCFTLGPERWSEVRDLFQRLQDRAGDKVLRTTASFLHELAKILHPEQVVSDLLPVYTRLLGGSEEIRERVFDHVDVIIDSVPKEVGWRLFEHLAQGWEAGMLGGWRAREKLALHIPSFLKTFEGWEGVEEVLEMMKDALLDPFAAVRDAATKGIPDAYEILGTKSSVAKRFREILLDLGDSSAFKRRLTFVRCLREFVKPPPNRTAFEDFFLPVLPRLSQDVVDVRLGLAQIIADLFVVGAYYAEVDKTVPQMIWQLASSLAQDDATDVRDTVRNVDMDRAVRSQSRGRGRSGTDKGKEVEVPYEIKTAVQPDRAIRPGERSPNNSKAALEGSSFPSVSSSAVAQATADRSNSASSSSSSLSVDIGSSSSSQDPTPTRRSPAVPVRRPSAEVSARLKSMQLSAQAVVVDSAGEDDSLSTPKLGAIGGASPGSRGAIDSPQAVEEEGHDPVTGKGKRRAVEANPFAASFGNLASTSPNSGDGDRR